MAISGFRWLSAGALAGVAVGQCPVYQAPQIRGVVAPAALNEISGLAVSRSQPGVLWVHNDSGDSARFFALSEAGVLLGEYLVSGAANIDWEDMAIGPGPAAGVDYLYLGDIGDNSNNRPQIQIYRVAEPVVPLGGPPVQQTLAGVQSIRLTYPDGPRDAETLMLDTNGDIYVVSKRVTPRGRVYRAAYPQATDAPSVLEFVAEIPWGSISGLTGATGGDISADGSAIIIRRATGAIPPATFWRRPPGATIGAMLATAGCNLTLRSEPQGESAAFTPCGWAFLTVSEGVSQPIYSYTPFASTAPPIADADCNGQVNFDDITCFTAALVSAAAWEACGHAAGCRYICANDVNRDGRVNFDDISPFVEELAGGR